MSSSLILNDCFSAQNLTEKELQKLNSLLFSKVAILKNKIIQLENQLENKHKDNKDDLIININKYQEMFKINNNEIYFNHFGIIKNAFSKNNKETLVFMTIFSKTENGNYKISFK